MVYRFEILLVITTKLIYNIIEKCHEKMLLKKNINTDNTDHKTK